MPQIHRVPYGDRATRGTFKCSDCGFELFFPEERVLPPCPCFDEAHTKRSWKFLQETRGSRHTLEEHYPVHKRKSMAIHLAMLVITQLIFKGMIIRVESFPSSRDFAELRRQLKSLSSGAFVRALTGTGREDYFDIMYKCQWPVSIVEHSEGLREIIDTCINRLSVGEPQPRILTAARSLSVTPPPPRTRHA